MIDGLAAFLVVAVAIIVTPGPDMALVTRNALAHGRRAALLTALGIEAGLLVWTAVSALGLAAILQTSTVAFTAVKIAGAAYLVYLGARSVWTALRSARIAAAEPEPRASMTGSPFRQGLLCNLLNPKIAVLFTSLIPQFVTPGPTAALQAVLFGLIFVTLGLIWITAFAFVASAAAHVLASTGLRRSLDALTGTILMALGVRLATEGR